jgi:hypothetical protein
LFVFFNVIKTFNLIVRKTACVLAVGRLRAKIAYVGVFLVASSFVQLTMISRALFMVVELSDCARLDLEIP